MAEPLPHDTPYPGAPCCRCGLRLSWKTAYTPCFEPGDTLETWKARQPEEILALIKAPREKRDA